MRAARCQVSGQPFNHWSQRALETATSIATELAAAARIGGKALSLHTGGKQLYLHIGGKRAASNVTYT